MVCGFSREVAAIWPALEIHFYVNAVYQPEPELREEMCQPAGRMRAFRLRNVQGLNFHAAVSRSSNQTSPSPIITPCQFPNRHSGICFAMTLRTERVNRWSYSTRNCALLRTVLCDFSVLTNSGYWTIPAIFRLSPACNAAFKEAKNARAFGSKLGENSATVLLPQDAVGAICADRERSTAFRPRLSERERPLARSQS